MKSINQSIKPTNILGNSIQDHPNNQGGSSHHLHDFVYK